MPLKRTTICKKCIPMHIEKKLECVETALTKAIESQLHSHIEKKLESVETTLTKAIESQLHPHIEKKLESVEIALTKTIESQLATKLASHHHASISKETDSASVLPMDTASSSNTGSFSSSNTNQLLASKSVDISTALSSALAEEKERSKRQLNLIIHNLEEAPSEDAQTRKDQDTQQVSEIFKHLGVKTSVNNATRLGKKGDKKDY